MDDKSKDKKLDEEIKQEIERLHLREKQCQSGRIQWIGERQAAMTITHMLMNKKDMNFSEANKRGWKYVHEERNKSCTLSEGKSDSTDLEQPMDKPGDAGTGRPLEAPVADEESSKDKQDD